MAVAIHPSMGANKLFNANVLFGDSSTQLPKKVVWTVIIICVLPYLLYLLGVDFSSQSTALDPHSTGQLSKVQFVDGMFIHLTGAFHHALLEWTAFATALFTVVLAFSHYSITKDVTTPIIGMALFFAGCMDAFHTLAAARLIEAAAANQDLIPFTWAICRIFNAAIMIAGVSLFMGKSSEFKKYGPKFIVGISLIFAVIAYAIISYCANSGNLPQTQYPDALITRPYDVIPLIMFAFAGLYLYPKFYHKVPNLFTHALIISAIPEVVVEIHMAFGSSNLFDAHFNMAHFLKIVAYVVPLIGLSLDYVRTYREEQKVVTQLEESKEKLNYEKVQTEKANINLSKEIVLRESSEQEVKRRAVELERSNNELREFAYVASHDLQEPLRMVASYTQLLSRKYKGQLDEEADEFIQFAVDGATRMQNLINDLLAYSRVDSKGTVLKPIALNDAYQWAVANLEIALTESGTTLHCDPLPNVAGDIGQLGQLMQNLIGNAIKFRGEEPLQIHITAERHGKSWTISIADNGIGIASEFQQRIFVIFQRLHNREEFAGTGIGLAVCKKIVERHEGDIYVTSSEGQGATFSFTLLDHENSHADTKNNDSC